MMTTMPVARDFQKKGALTQQDTYRRKVLNALPVLRKRWEALPYNDRRALTIDNVIEEAGVTKKTLEKDYHSETLKKVEDFLLTVGGTATKTPSPRPRKKRSSIFTQNAELAEKIEAVRYLKDEEIRRQKKEIVALQASLAAVVAERDLLKSSVGATAFRSSTRRPSQDSRGSGLTRIA
jgi:hypothetical protein